MCCHGWEPVPERGIEPGETFSKKASGRSVENDIPRPKPTHLAEDPSLPLAQVIARRAGLSVSCLGIHAETFTRALPFGYAMRIGQVGIRLSEGQRQHLALVRATRKETSVLVLDEATVMFDPEDEKVFLVETGVLI